MIEPDARLDQMVQKLKGLGYRLTPQRLALLKILATSNGHPGIEQIYEQLRRDFPSTSLATVYKTLTLLKELGEVLELCFSQDANRYDGHKPYPHPHLVCLKCREVLDPEVALPSEVATDLARQTGYRILQQRLDFYGLCPRCQQTSG